MSDAIHLTVRKARPGDWLSIETLHNTARRILYPMWPWEEHLADTTFVTVERGGDIAGALFAWPDASPVAWVRVAALADELDADAWLNLTLPPILKQLGRLGSRALAWIDHAGWAGPLLAAHAFAPLTDVVTMAKYDRSLPPAEPAAIHLRPACEADTPAVVSVDRAAFAPHWWQSEDTVQRRLAASSHFAVAEAAGEIVGYAEGELRLPAAHLCRIAVHPACQKRGIGVSLLREALHTFWQQGAERVTLNTQADNRTSQRLYRRFRFEPTGDSATVWELAPIPFS